jgi:hypothetical protein
MDSNKSSTSEEEGHRFISALAIRRRVNKRPALPDDMEITVPKSDFAEGILIN